MQGYFSFMALSTSCVSAVRQGSRPEQTLLSVEDQGLTLEGKRIGRHHVPEDELEAVFFDVDGTLLRTDHMYYPPWVQTAQEYGLIMSEDHYRNYPGPPSISIKALFFNQFGAEPDQEVVNEFEQKLRARVQVAHDEGTPEEIPAIFAIARYYKEKGIKTAITTTGFKDRVEEIPLLFKDFGYDDLFDVMVFGGDVSRGKPDPEVYLLAAEKLNVDPSKCRAYEDIDSGLKAAYAAGMEVIDVTYNAGYPPCQAQINRRTRDEMHRDWIQ